MALSKEKFLHLFLDELAENIRVAENQIILLKNDSENIDALTTLLRTLHTLKGSTRMLQFKKMESLVHGTETVFKGVMEGRYKVDARLLRFFFIVADHLRFSAAAIARDGKEELPSLELLNKACQHLSANEPFELSSIPALVLQDTVSTSTAKQDTNQRSIITETSEPNIVEPPKETHKASEPAIDKSHLDSFKKSGVTKEASVNDMLSSDMLSSDMLSNDMLSKDMLSKDMLSKDMLSNDLSIRVDLSTIDLAIKLVNTMTVRQLRLKSATDQMDHIEQKLSNAWNNSLDQKAVKKELVRLARTIRQFKAQYSDQLFEMDHGLEALRDAVIGMRMLPLSIILDRFPRMVEETALSLGKNIKLLINGDYTRLDRTVIDKLTDPLIHLVRNAVDHGIESPEKRKQAGKPSNGTITIDCKAEGNRISVTISDDGAGFDYRAIRNKAIALWPENEENFLAMGNEELAHLLFKPGFTTRSSSNTLSGRGIGLDIVKTNIEAVKGQIQLRSEAGVGSFFTLLLPVSASTMDGLFVSCSGRSYFVPAPAITRTLLISQTDCFRLGQREMFNLEGVSIALYDLSTALQTEQSPRPSSSIPVLLVRGPVETIGIVVDRILSYESLVYQSLPSGLKNNLLVQGIVFDSDFNIIPILNMWAVLDQLRTVRVMDTRRRYVSSGPAKKATILVVDDSISTREIMLSMLHLEGYDVLSAVDGVDALEKLRSTRTNLIVSDLNMPRMDGLKLLENVRADENLSDIPIIIVTTVDDPQIKNKANLLGADRYILKSSFDQDNLLDAVHSLISYSKQDKGTLT